ncbi:MAG TPA: hypothetical protein VHD36_04660 [Pirellulales bacterium]|nr:hypothetical protein [Pirellulales bacterium]
MVFGRFGHFGVVFGALTIAAVPAARDAHALEPAPMGVPGYVSGYATQPAGGYVVPVAPYQRAPVVNGSGARVVVRNAAPSVPGYVASYAVPVPVAGQAPAIVGYRASYEAPVAVMPSPPPSRPAPANARFYNPVGNGFGGYSYGEYPAYGYNGYLPAAYDGFNVSGYASRAVTSAGYRGFSTPAQPGGYSTFNMSDAWTGYIGPNGSRMNYRAY